jgi:hypothetical protein
MCHCRMCDVSTDSFVRARHKFEYACAWFKSQLLYSSDNGLLIANNMFSVHSFPQEHKLT